MSTASSFALTAAALFAAACSSSQTPPADASMASADTVKCQGIHSCKGQSQCNVKGGHSCAGQNTCSGKGWIKVTAAECSEKGGTVL
jgi:uncharacterized membrane protein